jgi:predicted O-methyltransferase YrrM
MEYPNWFDGQKYNFEEQLRHLAGKPNLTFLQIGAYTGDASVWVLENILTDKTSFLLDVDTWAGSNEAEHSHINFDDVYDHYKKRMEQYPNVRSARNNSDNFFKSNTEPKFDFIYIDGGHTAEQVSKDAQSAWLAVKPNGIIAFDDYGWGIDLPPDTTPKPAIDNFLQEHANEYTQLVDSYQVWIRKNDN